MRVNEILKASSIGGVERKTIPIQKSRHDKAPPLLRLKRYAWLSVK